MDGLGVGRARHGEQRGDVQVALRGAGRTDRVRLVGVEDMGRRAVGLGEDRDGADPQFPGPANNPQRDFPPVGDEHGFEQRGASRGRFEVSLAGLRPRCCSGRSPQV